MPPTFTLQPQYSLADLNGRSRNTMAEHLGIEFIEVGEDFLKAKMPVDHRTHQPLGMLNGGASFALAETVGSMAANLWIDRTQFVALGLDMNGNHLKGVREGFVYATARPFHQGKATSVWEIKIEDDVANLVCVCRLTMAIVELKK
ncbi:MAG: hotdog fold thioesterase [Flavobacteriaceae bacterium]|nr:hotdog fold thioesterase [Flavobacteriaceae bacterium]